MRLEELNSVTLDRPRPAPRMGRTRDLQQEPFKTANKINDYRVSLLDNLELGSSRCG